MLSWPSLSTSLQFDQGRRRQRLTEELARMRHLLSEESLASMPDYQNHVLALEKLGYLEPEGALTLKGRVARALSSHEVMLTELLLQESLLTLGAPEVAALFSSFVFEQRTEDELVIPKSMAAVSAPFLLPHTWKQLPQSLAAAAADILPRGFAYLEALLIGFN